MFGSGTIKTNIEAWRHASDTTLIDGGDIYTHSIVADAIAAKTLTLGEVADDAFTEIGHQNLIRNSVFNYDGQNMNYLAGSVEPAFWDITKSAGTFNVCQSYIPDEGHKKKPWEYVYYVLQASGNNDGTDTITLFGKEYITIDRSEPYTLSVWIKKQGTALKWYLGLWFYDSDKVACAPNQGYPLSMSGITSTTDSWTRYSGTFGPNSDDYDVAFPADCKYVRIRFLPLYEYGSGNTIGSMSTGLQLEPGDKLTNWKPWRPDFNETVLDLWQGESDTQILRLRSKSIDHDITQGGGLGYDWGTHTDCFYYMRKRDVAGGGLFTASFTESTADISYELYAIYGTANTAKDGNAKGAINLAGLKGDAASHGYVKCVQNDNILVVKTKPYTTDAYQAVFIIDEDGDVLYDGGTSAFQGHDDISLLKDVEDILGGKISKDKMKEKNVSKKHKVIHVNEVEGEEIDENRVKKTGKKRLDRFVSTKKLNMLFTGSILQLNDKMELEIQQLNEKIESLEARIR